MGIDAVLPEVIENIGGNPVVDYTLAGEDSRLYVVERRCHVLEMEDHGRRVVGIVHPLLVAVEYEFLLCHVIFCGSS